MGAENGRKPLGGRGSSPNPDAGALSSQRSQNPDQELHSAFGLRKFCLDFRSFGLAPNEKSWACLCYLCN